MIPPSPTNVLLLGSGGREHALAWKLRQSPRLGELWLADPAGNPGLLSLGRAAPPAEADLKNLFRFARWCDRERIHLVVVGPEAPLAAGVADALAAPHRLVFGPTKAAAQLEADKAFAKQLMRSASIPTAEARIFDGVEAARHYLAARDEPCVVKAAGLAAGKGVVVCDGREDALRAVERLMVEREFGAAGERILIEERLHGPEVSVLALCDGRTFWVLDPCQDHKRLLEGDRGPNTGGMGAYCPAPVLPPGVMAQVEREVLVPVIDALRREGIEYRGVLYAGLMLTPAGPKVLEFNCRFGDPECQAIMPRLRGDLLEALWAVAAGRLDRVELDFDPRTACCVVMAAAGYPGDPVKGAVIEGLDGIESMAGQDEELVVFHSGTVRDGSGALRAVGGRVLGVTALAKDLAAARQLANAACERIRFEGAQWRRDIGASQST